VDIYEPRDFTERRRRRVQHVRGIISESLVQCCHRGDNLPFHRRAAGIDSYVLNGVGTVRIEPTRRRNGSPPSTGAGAARVVESAGTASTPTSSRWEGAGRQFITSAWKDRPGRRETRVTTKNGTSPGYDLLVGAVA